MHTAVTNVEKVIAPALIAKGFHVATDLGKIDAFMKEMDGTDDKSKLGANAILGISMACARAGAASKVRRLLETPCCGMDTDYIKKGQPLYEYICELSGTRKPYTMPVPFFNVLNGGVHSGNLMAFQEFMIAPVGASSITHAVQMGAEVYQELKNVVKTKYGSSGNFPPITCLVVL